MANKAGRPGQDRAKAGRVRCAIPPDLKHRAEDLAHSDGRLRSLSQLIEAAIAFYLAQYQASGGALDRNNQPDIGKPKPDQPCNHSRYLRTEPSQRNEFRYI